MTDGGLQPAREACSRPTATRRASARWAASARSSRAARGLLPKGLGLPIGFAETLLAVMAVLFAGTTMDAGVRLQRYIVQEWGTIYSIPPLQNGYVATAVAVGACLVLAFGAGGRTEPAA